MEPFFSTIVRTALIVDGKPVVETLIATSVVMAIVQEGNLPMQGAGHIVMMPIPVRNLTAWEAAIGLWESDQKTRQIGEKAQAFLSTKVLDTLTAHPIGAVALPLAQIAAGMAATDKDDALHVGMVSGFAPDFGVREEPYFSENKRVKMSILVEMVEWTESTL